jgi:hypothetical protein
MQFSSPGIKLRVVLKMESKTEISLCDKIDKIEQPISIRSSDWYESNEELFPCVVQDLGKNAVGVRNLNVCFIIPASIMTFFQELLIFGCLEFFKISLRIHAAENDAKFPPTTALSISGTIRGRNPRLNIES